MTPETNEIFIKWLTEKYDIDSLNDNTMTPEWWILNEIEFKKYHPSAGTFVKNLTTEEFMIWINKFKNKNK